MKNLFNVLVAFALTLFLSSSALAQGPVPALPPNPWAGAPPNPPTPGCALGTTVEPICLVSALMSYMIEAGAEQSKASTAYVAAKVSYDNAVAQAGVGFRSCGTGSSQTTQAVCIAAYDAEINQALGAFNGDMTFATNVWVTGISLAATNFASTTSGCCVDIEPLAEIGGIPPLPTFPGCGLAPTLAILCPEGNPDPACNAACESWGESERAIACADATSSMNELYSALINSLDIALSKLSTAGLECSDAECIQAAITEYNATYNASWQDFMGQFIGTSLALDGQLAAIKSEVYNCLARCCP